MTAKCLSDSLLYRPPDLRNMAPRILHLLRKLRFLLGCPVKLKADGRNLHASYLHASCSKYLLTVSRWRVRFAVTFGVSMTSGNLSEKRLFSDGYQTISNVHKDSFSFHSPLSSHVNRRRKTVQQCKQRRPRAYGFGLQALLQTGVHQLSHGISSEMQKFWRHPLMTFSPRSALHLVSWYEVIRRGRMDIFILQWTGNALQHCNYTQHSPFPGRPFISEFHALIY